ncbi:MAG: hypothetical protein ACRDZ8_18105 [Acidimicrobiales bacterium]
MPTTVSEQVSAVEDQVLDLIHQGQDATLSAVREISNAVTSALPKVPEWVESFTASLPKFPEWVQSYIPNVPEQVSLPDIDNLVDFYGKVWDSQRQFNQKVIDAISPIADSALATAKETAKTVREATATATGATTAPAQETKTASHEATSKGSTRPAANRRTRATKAEA